MEKEASIMQGEGETSNMIENTKPKNGGGFCTVFYGFLFPKIAPTAWTTFFLLYILTAIPSAVFILGFSKMGYGKLVFFYIENNFEFLRYPIGIGIASYTFIMFLFDAQHWSGPGIALRNVSIFSIITALSILGILLTSDYPYGPIAVFIVLLPFYLGSIKYFLYNSETNRDFVHWLSGPLFLVAITTCATWILWTLWRKENEWNLGVALNEAEASGCDPDFDKYPDCDLGNGLTCFEFDTDTNSLNFDQCPNGESCQSVFEQCYNPFILWVNPFLASMGLLFLSFFASFLRGDGSPEQEASKFLRVWLFLLFAIWVTTSLAGAGTGVSTTLMALTLALFVAGGIFINIAFNSTEKKEKIDAVLRQTMEKYGAWMDAFRGLLVVTCTPIFLFYFVISFIIQRIRNITFGLYTAPPTNTMSLRNVTGEGWFTVEGRRIIRTIQSWNITKVMTNALYWGIFFMIMYVIVSQYTLVFLSWLIQKTSTMNIGLVTAILSGVGLIMFLLPPVPGVPIYLTLGIVVIPVGQETMGVVGVIVYAIGVSLVLKLLACTLQQKLIGGLLSNSVSIRQMVGINSNLIRAMKLVLQEPGLGIAKVSILIGGPDWPTSVLCGIMDLSLLPVLLGTLPIILLITPTLLTGSFTYMADARDQNSGELLYPWAGTMATLFAAITALVQFGSMVVAAFFLERVMSERKEEIEAIEIDEKVKEADERDEAKTVAYTEATEWGSLPCWAKFCLSLSLTCMIISCYMVQFFAGLCFRDYQLTYTIESNLDGDWKNLIKPLGFIANILFLVSIALLMMFSTWANRKANQKLALESIAVVPESNGITKYALNESFDDENDDENPTVNGTVNDTETYNIIEDKQ